MSATEPLPTPSLADLAADAWQAETERRAVVLADHDRTERLNARHLDRALRAIEARIGKAAVREDWKPCRQVAEPLVHSVDLLHPQAHDGTPWGLRYVSEISEAGVEVRNYAGALVREIAEYHDRLVLIRPCPDDPDEWTEVGWDLHGLVELGQALAEPVTPCGDHQGIWADEPGDLPGPGDDRF